MGDLFTGDRSSDAGPTIASRSRFPAVGRPTRLHRRGRIANAMTVAQQLSGPLADELLTSALQAFTSGLNAICLLTAVLSVALAELAVLCASGADRLRIEFRCGGARPVGTFMAGRVAFADPVEADWRDAGVVVEPDASPSKAVCRELTSP